jgi:hypothetical protein
MQEVSMKVMPNPTSAPKKAAPLSRDNAICPITHQPVAELHSSYLARDGYTYDKEALTTWLEMNGAAPKSPLTRQSLRKDLRNLRAMKLESLQKPEPFHQFLLAGLKDGSLLAELKEDGLLMGGGLALASFVVGQTYIHLTGAHVNLVSRALTSSESPTRTACDLAVVVGLSLSWYHAMVLARGHLLNNERFAR